MMDQTTISGRGTSSWVPEGATTARRVSPLKESQMSSCVTNLYVRGVKETGINSTEDGDNKPEKEGCRLCAIQD